MGDRPEPSVIGSGDFADVLDIGGGRVVKAFRAPLAEDLDLRAAQAADGHVSFRAERKAYERLQDHPDLEVFAPRYFGKADPHELVDGALRDRYLAGCGIVLERIEGEAIKIAHLDRPVQEQVESVLSAFKERIGVEDPWDGSCFVEGSPRAAFTVIDFATPSNELGAIAKVYGEHGRLTEALRERLGLPSDLGTL